MKVLVIGSGGREHALAWKLSQSPSVDQIFAMPGNPGIARVATCPPPGDYLQAAEELAIDLTIVGPEVPLVAGVVDRFRAAGRTIIGPTQAMAELEGSKVYAKRFFAEHNIPTAAFDTVDTPEAAEAVLARSSFPVVIKADGLHAGKGVVIAQDLAEARQAAAALGPQLVIEEFLEGEEVSFIVLCNGRDGTALEPCQDHKAAYDGDLGPNTGGMGAYCDSRILTQAQREQVMDQIIRPTIAATGFTGFLYAGLMMTAAGPKLLEYNVRLGDPEAQVILHRLKNDLAQVLLGHQEPEWLSDPSVCVVLAAAGYPGAVQPGSPIAGIAEAEATGATVFHAGTREANGRIETSGGRVLGVTARGPDLRTAIDNAYAAVAKISFPGMHFRRDIGQKGLRRYNEISSGT